MKLFYFVDDLDDLGVGGNLYLLGLIVFGGVFFCLDLEGIIDFCEVLLVLVVIFGVVFMFFWEGVIDFLEVFLGVVWGELGKVVRVMRLFLIFCNKFKICIILLYFVFLGVYNIIIFLGLIWLYLCINFLRFIVFIGCCLIKVFFILFIFIINIFCDWGLFVLVFGKLILIVCWWVNCKVVKRKKVRI